LQSLKQPDYLYIDINYPPSSSDVDVLLASQQSPMFDTSLGRRLYD